MAEIVDFDDQHNKFTREHANERRRVLTGTEGFAENLLPPGADFDFSIFSA